VETLEEEEERIHEGESGGEVVAEISDPTRRLGLEGKSPAQDEKVTYRKIVSASSDSVRKSHNRSKRCYLSASTPVPASRAQWGKAISPHIL